MNSKKPSNHHPNATQNEDGVSPGLKWILIAVLVLCCAGLAWYLRGRPSKAPADTAAEATGSNVTPAGTNKGTSAATQEQAATASVAASTPAPAASTSAPAVPVAAVPVDPAFGALVAGLKQLSGTNVDLTAQAVGAWRTNFMNLVQNGSGAVPALRAFLDQKTDYQFGQEAWQALGYSSARLAAIDALRQIGGPDAIAAMEGLLGTTQTPREIAVLARDLEEASPGQYREQALAAARSGLQAAALAQNPNADVAPLFEVFQHYGDTSAIGDLERAAARWNYYATIALANLPDGAGIPSILHFADSASGSDNRVVALEMVAQLATASPDARQFLLSQVKANQIPPNLWPYLGSPLAGDQYFPVDSAITQYPQLQSSSDLKTTRINSGNQNLYMLPGYQSLTADEISARIALVQELLNTATGPTAVQTLQQALTTLNQRSTRATAQTPPATGTGP
jgi:hypothetical protein